MKEVIEWEKEFDKKCGVETLAYHRIKRIKSFITQALSAQKEDIVKRLKKHYPRLVLEKGELCDKDWENKPLVKISDIIKNIKK